MSEGIPLPARRLCPQRSAPPEDWLERLILDTCGPAVIALSRLRRLGLAWIVPAVRLRQRAVGKLDDAALAASAARLRADMRRRGVSGSLVARAFSLAAEAAARTLGNRPYDEQLLGGLAILRGAVIEMRTGEGKTLTATLPAATAALMGEPVHIVTANDYLAARDADEMGPIYRALGLTVGLVTNKTPLEARRSAYAADVVYCTNKELVFDYLRDRSRRDGRSSDLRTKLERLASTPGADGNALRALSFAIVDEADSLLVDEARTPLVLSELAEAGDDRARFEQALTIAEELEPRRDYRLLPERRSVELTEVGRESLRALAEHLGGTFAIEALREHMAVQALCALHLFRRDEHYLVRDGKVVIIDEYTGRTMRDRFWSDGLHQMIEVKEGCEPSPTQRTAARITYQRFFRRYRRLGGMTGTVREAESELWSVYRLPVIRIPTHRRDRMRVKRTRICRTAAAKWNLIAARAAKLSASGRPVLIGTRSVAQSQRLSALLEAHGAAHRVLSAAQDAEEAAVIAGAGAAGCITVATNMAGRGADIPLGQGVGRKGGLHVILSEMHEAGRIDRQLAGRCARQGDPGSVECFLSLEDEILNHAHGPLSLVFRVLAQVVPQLYGLKLLRHAQRNAEAAHRRARRALMIEDERIAIALAVAGAPE